MFKSIVLSTVLCAFVVSPAFSQKYKTAADTVKLNKEYTSLSNDIAELTSKLTVAQNNLPGYQSKAADAKADAEKTASQNSEQASKATGGDLGDAKAADKKARRALKEAKSYKSAQDKVEDEQKKIDKLSKELAKKQQKLQELETMRSNIRMTQQ